MLIMTWNVGISAQEWERCSPDRLDPIVDEGVQAMLRLLQDAEPDVLCCQELGLAELGFHNVGPLNKWVQRCFGTESTHRDRYSYPIAAYHLHTEGGLWTWVHRRWHVLRETAVPLCPGLPQQAWRKGLGLLLSRASSPGEHVGLLNVHATSGRQRVVLTGHNHALDDKRRRRIYEAMTEGALSLAPENPRVVVGDLNPGNIPRGFASRWAFALSGKWRVAAAPTGKDYTLTSNATEDADATARTNSRYASSPTWTRQGNHNPWAIHLAASQVEWARVAAAEEAEAAAAWTQAAPPPPPSAVSQAAELVAEIEATRAAEADSRPSADADYDEAMRLAASQAEQEELARRKAAEAAQVEREEAAQREALQAAREALAAQARAEEAARQAAAAEAERAKAMAAIEAARVAAQERAAALQQAAAAAEEAAIHCFVLSRACWLASRLHSRLCHAHA
ncbi:MAG: hypothetical protein GY772_12615 [bacterium]|nr:hypothetical protein [bacterium]